MKKINFQNNQTVLFIGDSITDCRRRELPYAPLGWGYVHFAANLLLASRPELDLKIENRGISGDTTRALIGRWQQDCIDLKPNVVSLMIGINDLWYKYGQSYESQRMHVAQAEYEANVRYLLEQVRDKCRSQLILMEPYMFCDRPDDPMLKDLDSYIEIVHHLANDFDAVLVPVHHNYIKLEPKRPESNWAEDMVHPYEWAHAWIAQQWIDTVL